MAVGPGIHRSKLPWAFPGEFFLLTYHGSHSRVLFRSIVTPDDEAADDGAWDSLPTTDVMFVGVRRMCIDVTLSRGIAIREATVAEVAEFLPRSDLEKRERLFLLGPDVEDGWVIGNGVWWTTTNLPWNTTSPLLADLDFSKTNFSWEETGCVVFVDE
jgi:hypothetical protein